MKIRNKITVIMIPIILLAILLTNITFGLFFSNYLQRQEKYLVNNIKTSIVNFISRKQQNYLGTVNDWAHWDDTYDFVRESAPDYVANNLNEETFYNLNINFIIYAKDNRITNQFYYDFDQKSLIDLPAGFADDFDKVIDYIGLNEDTEGIFRLGDAFYFISSSDITDSLYQDPSVGKLIMGRRLDENYLSEITNSVGCSITSIEDLASNANMLQSESEGSQQDVIISDDKTRFDVRIVIANEYDKSSGVVLMISIPRNLYIAGMGQLRNFTIINALTMALVFLVIFLLLERYLSKPFHALLQEVKNIDLTGNQYQKISENSNGEFSFIRRSINHMLGEIEKQKSELVDAHEKLYATLVSVGDGVITADRQCNIDFINPVAQELTGWSRQEALHQPIDTVFHIIHEYTGEPVKSPPEEVFEKEETIEHTHHTLLISRDRTQKPIELTAAPIKDQYGSVMGCVLVFRDYSERKERQKSIEYLSYHDQMTGAYNRRYFEGELNRLDAKSNLPISFIYADVNGLKTINDAFGHNCGDDLIKQVAQIFNDECQSNELIIRIGGDEFILVLPKTDKSHAEELVGRCTEALGRQKIMGLGVSVSFGWDTKTQESQSVKDVLKNAENFMYQRKIKSNSNTRAVVIKSILDTLHSACPYEHEHSQRIGILCEAIGRAYHLNETDIQDLRLAGELHDIGKIAVDTDILDKPGDLSETELAELKNHPETGFRILGTSNEFFHIAECILSHHERWDGTGYPRGLARENILWKARVIAIADEYDALTRAGYGYEPLSDEDAAKQIKQEAGTLFDPDIARMFVEEILGCVW